MTAYEMKYGTGSRLTKSQKKQDAIKGLIKHLSVGNYEMVLIKERQLMNEFGMSAKEVEALEEGLYSLWADD